MSVVSWPSPRVNNNVVAWKTSPRTAFIPIETDQRPNRTLYLYNWWIDCIWRRSRQTSIQLIYWLQVTIPRLWAVTNHDTFRHALNVSRMAPPTNNNEKSDNNGGIYHSGHFDIGRKDRKTTSIWSSAANIQSQVSTSMWLELDEKQLNYKRRVIDTIEASHMINLPPQSNKIPWSRAVTRNAVGFQRCHISVTG